MQWSILQYFLRISKNLSPSVLATHSQPLI